MKLATILNGIDDMSLSDQIISLSKALVRLSDVLEPKFKQIKIKKNPLEVQLMNLAKDTDKWFTIPQLILQSNISGTSNTKFGLALKNIGAEKSRRKNKLTGNVSTMYRIEFTTKP